ncbi:Uncharacterized protein TCM_039739 [Theobroma cacao]|uniref:Transposase MuDR plant domain-containing protein n=1 Tax=Theobroma cacao TaxID=3641 RepID=A0A061GYH7_THECC|nr:Uncharacterized protein TCM_039739 [Theobroma cacao]
MQLLPANAIGPLLFSKDTMTTVNDDDAFDQMNDDYVEDDTTYWNDDNYVGRHDDCLEEDRGLDNDIPNCNYSDGSTKHAITVFLEDVQYDDLFTTTPSAMTTGFVRPMTISKKGSSDDCLYRGKVFPFKVELKRALNMLALKEHFEIRVKKSSHTHFEVACKDKACKFAVRATKLPDKDIWQVRTFHKVLMYC